MENLQHIKARIEREIEEVMGEKKWTPRHAEVIEELLSCEKCIKEIEKMAHAKKRMMGLPAPTEEEDEEMMEKPWHFGMYNRNDYARNGGRNNYNYRRGRNGYLPYNYDNYNNYEDDEYSYDFEGRGGTNNYDYARNDYHHDPEYLIWLKKKKHHKKDWDDDDDDEEEEEKLKKRMKKLWKQMQQEEHGFSTTSNMPHMPNQTADGNQGSNQTMGRTPTGTVGK